MTCEPGKPRITWYGDDFTGSTDALETLAAAGLNAVLFLDIPSPAELARFPNVQAIGLAGTSRSQSPQWMSEHLPAAFAWLRGLQPRVCHYKVCSTFDSSPEVGNIGRAIEIGREVFHTPLVPIIAGAPALGRFTAFGHLFASYQGRVSRIDRHPVMSRHPVTPMDEADLLVHLARQTSLKSALVPLPEVLSGQAASSLERHSQSGVQCALIDVIDDRSALQAGLAIQDNFPFLAGSSGVEHSLVAAWRHQGLLAAPPSPPPVAPADRIVVLSGSCAPTTWHQIHSAIDAGFAAFPIDPAAGDLHPIAAQARQALQQGRSVILHTSLDHTSPWLDNFPPTRRIDARHQLAARCGALLRDILLQSGVTRAVVAGGDTSSHAGRQLGLTALTYQAPLILGAPLCRAASPDPALDGLEIVFKGGQIGPPNFFPQALQGVAC